MKTRSQANKNTGKTDEQRRREINDIFSAGDDASGQAAAARKPPAEPVGGALPPPMGIFGTATGDGRPDFPPLPDLKAGFREIVRDLFADGLDVVAEYREIKKALSIDGALTPGNVQAAANRAEQMADRAYRLYVVAKSEHEAYLREVAVVEAALRDSAVASLEQEKANKTRTKMITDADVASEIARLHPDEWNDVQTRKRHAKGMLDYLGNLSDLSKTRCFTVSKMQRDK